MNVNLITREDLDSFKEELLSQIKCMLEGSGSEPQKKWLRSAEISKLLGGCSDAKLRRLRITGEIKYKKVGSSYLYQPPV